MHLIYITFPTKDEATRISTKLIKDGLIACANIYSNVTSVYKWEGKIQYNEEVTIICKTSDCMVENVIEFIRNKHSYACPCIISIKVEKGNEDFLKWVDNCCKVDY